MRRLLWSKQRLGLFARRTVPIDSVPELVGNFRSSSWPRHGPALHRAGARHQRRRRQRTTPATRSSAPTCAENAYTVGNTMLRQLRQAGHDEHAGSSPRAGRPASTR
ncbi:MAG: hypothetical protein U0133_01320 [Gemmatimonadales bacterium]